MKIWDKFIFGSLTIGSCVLIGTGIYFCAFNHFPVGAIICLTAGGGFLFFNGAKFLNKSNGYIECSYKEENSKKIVNQFLDNRKQQIEDKKGIELIPILQEAPIAFPLALQIVSNENKEGPPNNRVQNPFITNDKDIENQL